MNDRLSPEGLRYAQAVARTGSFSAAAREYDVTQPALSNAIRHLEKILGARLFERNTHGARPTVFGAAILPRVDAALAALADHLAERDGWAPPPWVDDPDRTTTAWYPCVPPIFRTDADEQSPRAFRRRGILITDRSLARA